MENSNNQLDSSAHNVHSSRLATHAQGHQNRSKFNFKKLIKPICAAVFLAILIFGGMFLYSSTTSSSIDESKYQAVFLSNGQVYFGKLHIKNGGYMVLSDIFYLQSKTEKTDDIQAASGDKEASVELVKLGSEIHGPADQMIINVEQVLFFENLKTDGKVSQSITQYKNSQNN